jgi:hypothetical protein
MKIKKYNEFVNIDADIDADIKVDVKSLMKEVYGKCGNCSDLDIVAENTSYRKIVENGTDSISFLIEDIRNNKGVFWLKALQEITGEKLSTYDYSTSELKKLWINWADENGY